MKTTCDVLKKLGQLAQSNIASTSGNDVDPFIAAECNDQGLLVTAIDEDGLRHQFRISAESVNEPEACTESPTADATAAPAADATECCGAPTECSQEGAEGPAGETAESSVPPAAEATAPAKGSAD